jgi:hypothetical protein
MKEAINKIFLSEGFEVFSDFNRLMELLDKEGVQETKIHALCLILYACPSILEVLKQNELSQADGTRIVNMAVNATSLNINYVRQILYELASGLGVSFSDELSIMGLIEGKFPKKMYSLLDVDTLGISGIPFEASLPSPNEIIESAMLFEDENIADLDILNSLYVLALKGNAEAAYKLGEIFYKNDVINNTEYGLVYFRHAARLGFGSAFGAMADYILRSKRPDYKKAAKYYLHPAAVALPYGNKWSTNAKVLMEYKKNNESRFVPMLTFSIAALILSILIMYNQGIGTMNMLAFITSSLAIIVTVFIKYFFEFQNHIWTFLILALSWLFMILSVL